MGHIKKIFRNLKSCCESLGRGIDSLRRFSQLPRPTKCPNSVSIINCRDLYAVGFSKYLYLNRNRSPNLTLTPASILKKSCLSNLSLGVRKFPKTDWTT
jgi:hypothetical protein